MHHLRRLTVLAALAGALAVTAPATAAVRQYWIAAVPDHAWNIVPNGQDAVTGTQFDSGKTTLDTVVYRGFTPNWKAPLAIGYDGIPGPTIHARVGDVILVHFLDLQSDPPPKPEPEEEWKPERAPSDVALLAGAVADRAMRPLKFARQTATSTMRFGNIMFRRWVQRTPGMATPLTAPRRR